MNQFNTIFKQTDGGKPFVFVVNTLTKEIDVDNTTFRGHRGVNFRYVGVEFHLDGEAFATSIEGECYKGMLLISPHWMANCRFSKWHINGILKAAGLEPVEDIAPLTMAMYHCRYPQPISETKYYL
jgi:hypothetical protein